MKFTLPPPLAIAKRINMQALRIGRKLRDAFVDFVQRGLAFFGSASSTCSKRLRKRRTKFPVIKCRHAVVAETMTPERVAQILLDQEVEAFHAAIDMWTSLSEARKCGLGEAAPHINLGWNRH